MSKKEYSIKDKYNKKANNALSSKSISLTNFSNQFNLLI